MIKPKYLLDTNICIYLMKHQPQSVIEKFATCQVGEVAISAITWGELQRGLYTHQSKQQFDALESLLLILPFDANAGVIFGEVMRTKKVKANFDTLIASHALSGNLVLVTNNETDFKPFADEFSLTVENWVITSSN